MGMSGNPPADSCPPMAGRDERQSSQPQSMQNRHQGHQNASQMHETNQGTSPQQQARAPEIPTTTSGEYRHHGHLNASQMHNMDPGTSHQQNAPVPKLPVSSIGEYNRQCHLNASQMHEMNQGLSQQQSTLAPEPPITRSDGQPPMKKSKQSVPDASQIQEINQGTSQHQNSRAPQLPTTTSGEYRNHGHLNASRLHKINPGSSEQKSTRAPELPMTSSDGQPPMKKSKQSVPERRATRNVYFLNPETPKFALRFKEYSSFVPPEDEPHPLLKILLMPMKRLAAMIDATGRFPPFVYQNKTTKLALIPLCDSIKVQEDFMLRLRKSVPVPPKVQPMVLNRRNTPLPHYTRHRAKRIDPAQWQPNVPQWDITIYKHLRGIMLGEFLAQRGRWDEQNETLQDDPVLCEPDTSDTWYGDSDEDEEESSDDDGQDLPVDPEGDELAEDEPLQQEAPQEDVVGVQQDHDMEDVQQNREGEQDHNVVDANQPDNRDDPQPNHVVIEQANPLGAPQPNPVGIPQPNPVGVPHRQFPYADQRNPMAPNPNMLGAPQQRPPGRPQQNIPGAFPPNPLGAPFQPPPALQMQNPLGAPVMHPPGAGNRNQIRVYPQPQLNPLGAPQFNPLGAVQQNPGARQFNQPGAPHRNRGVPQRAYAPNANAHLIDADPVLQDRPPPINPGLYHAYGYQIPGGMYPTPFAYPQMRNDPHEMRTVACGNAFAICNRCTIPQLVRECEEVICPHCRLQTLVANPNRGMRLSYRPCCDRNICEGPLDLDGWQCPDCLSYAKISEHFREINEVKIYHMDPIAEKEFFQINAKLPKLTPEENRMLEQELNKLKAAIQKKKSETDAYFKKVHGWN